MIVLITDIEDGQPVVSHGVDYDTLQTIVLPQVPVSAFGRDATYFSSMGHWVLIDSKKPTDVQKKKFS